MSRRAEAHPLVAYRWIRIFGEVRTHKPGNVREIGENRQLASARMNIHGVGIER